MNLSKTDITKLVGFLITALSGLTASQLHVLFPHADTDTISTVAAWVAYVTGFATLAFSTLKRQTPDDGHAVYSPTPAPDPATLTTSALEKARG